MGGQQKAKGSTTCVDVGMAGVCPEDPTGGGQELGHREQAEKGHQITHSHFCIHPGPHRRQGEACEDLRLPVFLKLIIKKKKRSGRKLLQVMDMLMA